ncbi:MAG: endolytic transglycosylase MltG, partial [Clostridia bacterium]|nr:endolytic transglycosylase MltG [Clostridia bacterium]
MEDNFFKFEDEPNEKTNTKEETTLEINDDFVIGGGFVIEARNDNKENSKDSQREIRRKKREDRYEYYEDTPERRRKSVIKTVIWAVCIFTMAILLAVGIIYFGADYMGIGFGRGKTATIEIPLGSSTKAIAEKLEESGAVKSPFLFRVYSKLKKYDGQYKYGVYTFDTESGYEGLAQMLIKEGAKAETVKVKIPEGATIDQIKKLLAEAGVCDERDFVNSMNNDEFEYDFIKDIPTEKLYYRLEGYLYPDTYEFYSYDSEECAYLAINKMLSNLDSKLTDDMRKKIKESNYTFHEIMSLSSV